MSFANITKPKSMFGDTKKIVYLDLTGGTRVIRILQDKAISVMVHWVNRASFECLGDDCPVCANNIKLVQMHPKGAWRNQPQWSPARATYLVNVLDRTMVKTCPKCAVEVYKNGTEFPGSCPECGTFLTTVTPAPSNKVKVLSRGVTLFERLNGIASSNLDDNQEPIPMTNYDISLLIQGTGTSKDIMPMPLMNKIDIVSVSPDQLFDLTLATPKLTVEEVMNLQKGVQLRDIFLARKDNPTDVKIATKAVEENDEVKKKIDALFGSM